jgi:hypothetical protein
MATDEREDQAMTTATNTMMNELTEVSDGDGTEARVARHLLDSVWRYASATQSASKMACYIKEDMVRINERLNAGLRVDEGDTTSWHRRLAESIADRQNCADRIREASYMLGLTDEQVTALWQEIEGKADAFLGN